MFDDCGSAYSNDPYSGGAGTATTGTYSGQDSGGTGTYSGQDSAGNPIYLTVEAPPPPSDTFTTAETIGVVCGALTGIGGVCACCYNGIKKLTE